MMKSPEPKPRQFAVPSHEDVDPEQKRLRARRVEIQLERQRLIDEGRSITDKISASRSDEPDVLAGLIDGDFGLKELREVIVEKREDWRGRYGELSKMVSTCDDLLRRIEQRVAARRMQSSKKICEALREQYDELVLAIIRPLFELHSANRAYREAIEQFFDRDVSWTSYLPVMHPTFLGHPRDKHDRLARYLKEAAAAGYIKEDDIPPELRP